MKTPFKLRSGNKPSIAKLSGVVETRQDNTRTKQPNKPKIVKDNKYDFTGVGSKRFAETIITPDFKPKTIGEQIDYRDRLRAEDGKPPIKMKQAKRIR